MVGQTVVNQPGGLSFATLSFATLSFATLSFATQSFATLSAVQPAGFG
jgi:hypothetical protein